jgi:hypothetical protein
MIRIVDECLLTTVILGWLLMLIDCGVLVERWVINKVPIWN